MTSSSDSDETTSSDTEDESVFYDASSSISNPEISTSFQHEPRWRISSKNDCVKRTEHFSNFPLTDDQVQDIERRDKLQRLRAQDNRDYRTNHSSIEHLSSSSIDREETASSTPDLLKDHIDNEQLGGRQKQNFISKETFADHQRSLPSGSQSPGRYFPAVSEPNIVDLKLIDRITKFGEGIHCRKLDDEEILQQAIVRNLDNGKYIPLSDANPMTQTIMERAQCNNPHLTSARRNSTLKNHPFRRDSSGHLFHSDENNSRTKTKKSAAHNDEKFSTLSESSSHTTGISSSSAASKSSTTATRSATSFFQGGKRQLTKLVMRNFLRGKGKKNNDEPADPDDEEDETERLLINDGSNGDLKYKASRTCKEPIQFDKTQLLQTMVKAHDGPIWCMRFSPDGHLLATGGQDNFLKVWALRAARTYFNDFARVTSDPSKQQNEMLSRRFDEFFQTMSIDTTTTTINARLGLTELQAPLYPKPFCVLNGHQAPVLDVAWSRSLFLLSSSMDKTVRLWHLSRSECLCFFRHVDFVSAIAFHPRDDRYFISGSLDGHVRLWNIPDKRVVYWTLIPAQASSQITAAQANLITAVNFCDEGRKVNVGTFDGRFLLYSDSLRYDTVMNIGDKDENRSHRSRKKRRKACKITGIESMNTNNSKVLITSNDSRVRLYDIRTKEIERKYRGYSNQSSQIRASFSHDEQYIISGSEDSWFYIWKSEPTLPTHSHSMSISSSTHAKLNRKQRRQFDRAFERIRVHNTMVTCAIFAPNSVEIMDCLYQSSDSSSNSLSRANPNGHARSNLQRTVNGNHSRARSAADGSIYVMLTADSKGQLKLLVNRFHRM